MNKLQIWVCQQFKIISGLSGAPEGKRSPPHIWSADEAKAVEYNEGSVCDRVGI